MTKWIEDITASGILDKSLFDANTILKADTDNTPEALTVAEQRLVGRITSGEITALTAAQVATLVQGSVDHGSIAGLGDVADHAYALLHNGTRALSGAWSMGSQATTNVNIDSGTIGGVTLDGAIAGGDQAFTGVGDMTFTDGSILAAVDGAGTTLLIKAGGLTGTTFITLTSQSGGTDTMTLATFGMGGAAITGHAQAITDNALLTVDGSPNSGEYAVWTGNGLDGKTLAEFHTLIFASALPENVTIILDALLSADEKWSGTSEIGTMGYGATTVGDLIYLDGVGGNNKWELAKADVAATSKGKLGLVLEAVAENATCQVLLYGKMRSAAFPDPFTVGAPVHISAATAGDMAVAAPTGTTNFVVRIIGYGNTAEDLFFCPDNTYVELA